MQENPDFDKAMAKTEKRQGWTSLKMSESKLEKSDKWVKNEEEEDDVAFLCLIGMSRMI